MIQFRDTGTGAGRLYDRTGGARHTTRHIPRERRLFGHRWAPVVMFEARIYLDTGRFDSEGFRAYCEAPEIETWGD